MNVLGTSSAYSSYGTNSVYGPTPVSPIRKQGDSDAKISTSGASSTDDINDEAIISDEAKALFESEQKKVPNDAEQTQETQQTDSNTKNENTKETKTDKGKDLTPEQQQLVAKLKTRDAEVKTHEQAHRSAAAGISASAPSYNYETGPDGQKYAIGGEVNLSFPMSSDPAENIKNAETMKAAALAPADPSGQDMSVAGSADKIIAEARQQQAQEKTKNSQSTGEDKSLNGQQAEQTDTPAINGTEDKDETPPTKIQSTAQSIGTVPENQQSQNTDTQNKIASMQTKNNDILKGKTEVLPTLSLI